MGQTGAIKSRFCGFLAFISFIIALDILNVLGGHRKPYIGSQKRWLDLWIKLGP